MDQHMYNEYLAILREEIVPALGCTEPIAIAYASAKARSVLGCLPEHITVKCSGNIIKNVKAVIVPTTGDMKGIETSAVLGAVGGNPDKKLEVLVVSIYRLCTRSARIALSTASTITPTSAKIAAHMFAMPSAPSARQANLITSANTMF